MFKNQNIYIFLPNGPKCLLSTVHLKIVLALTFVCFSFSHSRSFLSGSSLLLPRVWFLDFDSFVFVLYPFLFMHWTVSSVLLLDVIDLLGDCVIEYLPFKVICSGDQRIRRKLGKKCILYLGTYIGIIEYIWFLNTQISQLTWLQN